MAAELLILFFIKDVNVHVCKCVFFHPMRPKGDNLERRVPITLRCTMCERGNVLKNDVKQPKDLLIQTSQTSLPLFPRVSQSKPLPVGTQAALLLGAAPSLFRLIGTVRRPEEEPPPPLTLIHPR